MKSYKILLFFVFSLVLISSIGLADKVEIVQKDGILISDVNQDYIEEGKNYTFDFHLEKLQDGTAISDNNTECYFNLYGEDGKLLHYGNLSYEPDGARNNWEIEVSGDLLDIGEKRYLVQCTDDLDKIGGSRSESIEVTPTGTGFDEGRGYASLFVLLGIFGLITILMIIGFKMSKKESTLPIGFLLVFLGLLMGLYGFHLVYSFSHDFLMYQSELASTVYTTVLYTLSGIAVISAVMMLISFIKELGKMKDRKKFGDNFNPMTGMYE